MFEKFHFSFKQIDRYYKAARGDLKIAIESDVSEVAFRFCYDALLKLAIAVCAKNGLRVKSRKGHHIELIGKLAHYLGDSEIDILANEMRAKRNKNLYDGGVLISAKEAASYLKWVKEIFQKVESFFNHSKDQKLKI